MIGFLTVVALAILWIIWTFNRLVRARNQQAEAWSGVDVQLKKRSDLVPRLVECVRAFRDHEASSLRGVVGRRSPNDVTNGLRRLIAIAESYPEIQAAENFQKLMRDLVIIEDDLQFARRYFNGSVRDFRNLAESFPSVLVARPFGFRPAEFFEVESVIERSRPEVEL